MKLWHAAACLASGFFFGMLVTAGMRPSRPRVASSVGGPEVALGEQIRYVRDDANQLCYAFVAAPGYTKGLTVIPCDAVGW